MYLKIPTVVTSAARPSLISTETQLIFAMLKSDSQKLLAEAFMPLFQPTFYQIRLLKTPNPIEFLDK